MHGGNDDECDEKVIFLYGNEREIKYRNDQMNGKIIY